MESMHEDVIVEKTKTGKIFSNLDKPSKIILFLSWGLALLFIIIGIVAGIGGLAGILYYAFGIVSIGEVLGIVENATSMDIPADHRLRTLRDALHQGRHDELPG